jgi:cytochrome c-type biogenesis protein CcmH
MRRSRIFRPGIFRVAQTLILCLLTVVMVGYGETPDARFQRLGHELVCMCGDNNILLECNHVGCSTSTQMTAELKAQLATGASDKQILAWFANKYGPTVLAAPIRGGFDDVAWIVPYALLGLATLGTAGVILYWKRRTTALAHGPEVLLPADEAATPVYDPLRDRIRRETEGL